MPKTFSITRPVMQMPQLGSLWTAPEQASQTYLEGALLNWDAAASGVEEMASNAAVGLAGVAEQAGQNGSTGTKTAVFAPMKIGWLLEINLATAAGNIVLALTHIGALVGFVKRSSGTAHWVCDPAQTQKHGRIVKIASSTMGSPNGQQGEIGDTNARVLVSIANDVGW